MIHAMIRSAMTDMMPRAGGLPGIADTDLDGFLRELRRDSDWLYRLGLMLGALLYHLTPPLTVGIPLPAAALPAKLRDRHASRVVTTKIYALRQAVYLVRLNAGMCWGKDPAVRAHFDLEPYAPDPGTFRTS